MQRYLFSGGKPILKNKRGAKLGSRVTTTKTAADWYTACKTYKELTSDGKGKGLTKASFLRSDASGSKFSGTQSEQQSFSKMMQKYENGTLSNLKVKRMRAGKYEDVENKFIEYLGLRAMHYKQDKCGMSWTHMQTKALEYALQLNYTKDEFKASHGWLSNTLKRHGKIGIRLHGEADEMSDENRLQIINEWKAKEFHPIIEKYSIPLERIYNADQTGLYYQKLPNRMYVDADKKKSYAGAKQMKDKTRITLMVATSASGTKVPMAMIGKPKSPICFTLCDNKRPPMAYMDQKNAWFDREITRWWINKVFWPHYQNKFGNSDCILLLDNCSAHHGLDDATIPKYIRIVYLPPNVTSRHQPADMGMIASLKCGYKLTMLEKLLAIFDAEGGYGRAAQARARAKKGTRGLVYGGKAHILDAMQMINDIWNTDGKYARESGIQRCWRKANILPIDMETSINQDLGSNSVPVGLKTLSGEDCDLLCSLMKTLHMKAKEVDTNYEGYALSGSFAADEHEPTRAEFEAMAESWIDIEDQPEIIDAEVEEFIQQLESEQHPMSDWDDSESEDSGDETDSDDELTFVQGENMVHVLRKNGLKWGLDEETQHLLERYGRNLTKAKLAKPKKDVSLHSFFGPKK